MQALEDLGDPMLLNNLYREETEPTVSKIATNRATKILDAKYEKANLPKIFTDNCKHLSVNENDSLLQLLLQHEELFDGTLGDWQDVPVKFELKPDAKPYHGRPFPIPHVH